jgi:hypothetical protein
VGDFPNHPSDNGYQILLEIFGKFSNDIINILRPDNLLMKRLLGFNLGSPSKD